VCTVVLLAGSGRWRSVEGHWLWLWADADPGADELSVGFDKHGRSSQRGREYDVKKYQDKFIVGKRFTQAAVNHPPTAGSAIHPNAAGSKP